MEPWWILVLWTINPEVDRSQCASAGGSNLHMNAILVLTIQDSHGLNGLGDSLASTDEDAIDIESEDEGVGDRGSGVG